VTKLQFHIAFSLTLVLISGRSLIKDATLSEVRIENLVVVGLRVVWRGGEDLDNKARSSGGRVPVKN